MLIPLLRNATLPLSTSLQDDGRTQVKLGLSPALLSLSNEAFQSREGWLAFAHILHIMATCSCDIGFDQRTQTVYREPTRIHIDLEAVELTVHLYPTTQLDVRFGDNLFSYSSDGSSPPLEVANNFFNWFLSVASSDPFYLKVDQMDITVDDMSRIATLSLKLHGLYDEASHSLPLVNPTWIPTFIVKSDQSVDPPAEVVVTPWKISLQSTDRYPPFDRLLDLLEYGAVPDAYLSTNDGFWWSSTNGSTSGSTSGSYAGGSSSEDGCSRSAGIRQSCFDDYLCRTVISERLLPNLRAMNSSGNDAEGYSCDMTTQIMYDVFIGVGNLEVELKLLALLQYSSANWTTTTTSQEVDSCLQLLANAKFPGVTANLEITPAMNTFPVEKGSNVTVYTLTGEIRYYIDNGDSVELADFMENTVLGGYNVSRVRVKASVDWDSMMYTFVYDGLMAASPPLIVIQTKSSMMQFKFTASRPELSSVFSPWMEWLDPNYTSSSK